MNNIFTRTRAVLGSDSLDLLQKSSVMVLGLGGVGGFTAEVLARSGIGHLTLVDYDTIDESNINRQIVALHSTIGQYKTDLFEGRIKDINPNITITKIQKKIDCENLESFKLEDYDYICDCIDLITSKICIAEYCDKKMISLISSMGFGNKIDPLKIKVSDINKTSYCPIAKVMRKALKERNVKKLKVVWSDEAPSKTIIGDEHGKRSPGSVGFVPSVAGIVIASEVIKDLIGKEKL